MRVATILVLLLTWAGARAASLESLVMPGEVAAAHADFEDECGSCHAAFSKTSQTSLCLDCHEQIAADLAGELGFHGTNGRLANQECRSCHSEHKGRDADITGLVPESFDHALTGFSLSGRHASAACQDCHRAEASFRDARPDCHGCHQADDVHRGNLGSECQACHDVVAWRDHSFDHGIATDFALRGGHADVACGACHIDQRYQDTPAQCASCHALDDVHQGSRGSDCASCHSEQAWTEARFDHRAETGFALAGTHAELACASCHLDAMALQQPPQECNGCHSADDVHRGGRGSACGDCHDQRHWTVQFAHAERTGFALLGRHAELACDDCHLGNLLADLPTDCEGCHETDDPHGGKLSACTDCHAPHGWTEPLTFDHEFTRFPLLGMHRLAACEQCHVTLAFRDVGRTCADCHHNEDIHGGSLGDDCAQCHVPSGWGRWQFDHARQTDFQLTGAHADLACEGCHTTGEPLQKKLSHTCASCHRQDDVHNGQFGEACDRCHSTSTFAEPGRMF